MTSIYSMSHWRGIHANIRSAKNLSEQTQNEEMTGRACLLSITTIRRNFEEFVVYHNSALFDRMCLFAIDLLILVLDWRLIGITRYVQSIWGKRLADGERTQMLSEVRGKWKIRTILLLYNVCPSIQAIVGEV